MLLSLFAQKPMQLHKAFSHSGMMNKGNNSHLELIFSEISQNSLVVTVNCPVMHLCFEHDSICIIKSAQSLPCLVLILYS